MNNQKELQMEDANDGMESNEQDGMEIEFDDTDAVELVKYVIHCDGQHDAVAQIVKKRFSHHFPPRR